MLLGWMHKMYTHTFAVISKKKKNYIVKRYKYCFCDECILYLKISVETRLFKSSSNEQPMWDFSALLKATWENTNHIKLLQN